MAQRPDGLAEPESNGPSTEQIVEFARRAASDPRLATLRADLAHHAADVFEAIGHELHATGHIIGSDRAAGRSPFGHGDDETVGVSTILRIASQLLSASADLFTGGRPYAAAALARQLVEVEYLAWAFDTRDEDAARWLRSDRDEREELFRPAKLRKASAGRFRGSDYSHHCELGGHPVPRGAMALLGDAPGVRELLISDVLGHADGIWNHVRGWAGHNANGGPVLARARDLSERFDVWRSQDPLLRLPPPPAPHD